MIHFKLNLYPLNIGFFVIFGFKNFKNVVKYMNGLECPRKFCEMRRAKFFECHLFTVCEDILHEIKDFGKRSQR